jgi:antirestriction protein ArdC
MSEFRDVYSKITDGIVADLEQGVRPWMQPWSADHAAGKITRPLRYNGIPYKGINVLMLWSASVVKGYSCPIWLTFKQALELGGNVKKGERGELVVYANRITRTETGDNGEETEREIPFLKGYTVFNAEQCEGLPAQYTAKVEPPALPPAARCEAADRFFAATGAEIHHGGTRAYYAQQPDYVQMPPFETFRDAESYAATLAHEFTTGPSMKSASTAIWAASAGAMKVTPRRSSLRNWDQLSFAPISKSRPRVARITPLISAIG